MATLLIIDDEPSICWGLAELGKRLKHNVLTASSAESGLELARKHQLDLILLDVRLPGMDGLAALPLLKELVPSAPITVMTAHGDLSTAVEAVRQGAFDYVAKPFDLDHIERVIERSLAEPISAAAPATIDVSSDGLIGRTAVMQEVFKRIALVAPTSACVLLTGESGTGKELVARAIHRYSRRSNEPFVAVNVAALSPTLAESELFGHVRGAFTGADQIRTGLLGEAGGGTLFLDEVADIPLQTQVKLLRALEHGEVTPVGSNQTVQADFRLICATHQSLDEKVGVGDFRHDLYYRLSTFCIDLPPLRQRRDDIPLLTDFFAQKLANENSAATKLSGEALHELIARHWHGNVRELRNAIEHALILSRDGIVLKEHLPAPLSSRPTSTAWEPTQNDAVDQLRTIIREWANHQPNVDDSSETLYEAFLALVEPPFLEAVLKRQQNQCSAAARTLGIHRTTLKKKLNQYGIEGEE